jgi:ABC-type amino acid transport substrate-binding protein
MRPLRALGSLASLVLLLAGATAPPSIAPSIVPRIDPEPIRSDIATLAADDFNGRSFRSDEARRAARWIAEKLADAGAKPLVQGADGEPTMLVPIGRMPAAAPNVVAWIPPAGKQPSGEYILITAHYDHLPPKSGAKPGEDAIYNGADDNASGVCGMIAAAKAMRDDALDVGVVFVAFTGEEAGLVGSRAFVEEETLPLARIRGVLNMDMISRQPDGAIRLDGGPKGKPLVDVLVRLAPEVPIEMKVDTHPDWLDRSDQGAFLRVGIPAVLFSCEDHEDYHQVTDHADKVDAALAAKVASLVVAATRTYAREMQPRFDRSPILAEDGTQRRAIRVGRTMPNTPYWKPATRRSPDRGFDAAVVEELAKRTGLRFEEKSVAIGAARAALEAGEIDLVANGWCVAAAGLDPAAIRAIPALASSGVSALVGKDAAITDAASLAGKRIVVRPGTAAEAWLKMQDPPIACATTSEPDGAIVGRIEKGEVDAYLCETLAAEARLERSTSLRSIVLVRADAAFLLRASDAAVADRIGEALKACNADGTAQSLRTKHLRGQ